MNWNRTQCQEKVCTCHDDSAEPYFCSGCGCQPAQKLSPSTATFLTMFTGLTGLTMDDIMDVAEADPTERSQVEAAKYKKMFQHLKETE